MILTGAVTIANSLRRLGEFLGEKELELSVCDSDATGTSGETPGPEPSRLPPAAGEVFRAAGAGLSWDDTGSGPRVLHDACFGVKRGQLNMIVGPVGSGKSSALSAMLGEMVLEEGTITALGDRGPVSCVLHQLDRKSTRSHSNRSMLSHSG